MRSVVVAIVSLSIVMAAGEARSEELGGQWPPGGTFEVKAPDWGGPNTIIDAAKRIAVEHRDRGAKAAFQLIKECYSSLDQPTQYSDDLVICITQDYLETTTLSMHRNELSPDVVNQIEGASAEALVGAFKQRFQEATKTIAFSYSSPVEQEISRLTQLHGLPVYLAIAFPELAAKAVLNSTDILDGTKN